MVKVEISLSQLIRDVIHEKKMTQAEVARAAGMSPQQLNDTLSGVDPKFSTVVRIAKALGLELWELLKPAERAQEAISPQSPPTPSDSRRALFLEVVSHLDQVDERALKVLHGMLTGNPAIQAPARLKKSS